MTDQKLARKYDREARVWQRSMDRLLYSEAYDVLVGELTGMLPTSPTVLDAGCGTGSLSQALLAAAVPVHKLTLMDISQAMLARAQATLEPQGTDIETVHAGLQDFAMTERRFDLVLCGHVIEHDADTVAALGHLACLLNPGGVLALAVSKPHWCTALVQLRWGSRAYRPARVLEMLETVGLGDARAVPFLKGPPSRTSMGYIAHRS